MASRTCTYCQGMGTTGGSFPGIFGPYVAGQTCSICGGSGKEYVYEPVTAPRKRIDATGTPFGSDYQTGLPSAEVRMQRVAEIAPLLSQAIALHDQDPDRMSGAQLAIWQAKYDRALKAYTDPFNTRSFA